MQDILFVGKNGIEFSNMDIEFSTIKYLALSNVKNKCIDYVGIGGS